MRLGEYPTNLRQTKEFLRVVRDPSNWTQDPRIAIR